MPGKVAYRVRNWKKYNEALINRGDISIWLDPEAFESWYCKTNAGDVGRPRTYSDGAIQLALVLRSLLKLPLRSTQGFMKGLFKASGIHLEIPSYTQISRRASGLKVSYRLQPKTRSKTIDIVVDSTGLKIYGEGEWKMRTHGKSKRRTWRKLHISADANTHQILAMELTPSNIHDDAQMKNLLKNEGKTRAVYADGAYISKSCFDAIKATGARARIALRSGTSIKKNPSSGEKERNRLIREIWRAGGKVLWKKKSDYHRRSLVETQMYRIKQILGPHLSSRKLETQITEAKVKMLILNKMTQMGMPDSYSIKAK